ncbi:MAG TPA: hypothetical protein VGL78_14195 [Solirubrobacteraceae bacterium]
MLFRIKRLMLLAVLPAGLAAGCGSGSKTTDAPATTTTKHKSAPSAQSAHYHVGEHCRQSLSFAYSAQGLSCVNGTLRHKSQHATPATVHHHSHTTTAAPQGY